MKQQLRQYMHSEPEFNAARVHADAAHAKTDSVCTQIA
jgi:hypothetical protein